MAGGFMSASQEEKQRVLEMIKPLISEKLNMKHCSDCFKVVSHEVQVVAGVNHKLRIQVSDSECIHVKAFESLDGEFTIQQLLEGKSLDETF
ncbi:hypothetical protein C9374_003570 [Naegleria lovaniensis]|uniref:Cystatin domain-containing protein n=1 Tax=Naegleria lovaniensis TaxID=51637 RepID=A0AA88H7C7_NAELO|nr:uncharacterized protein C9374_003570 [Naegleria lovaniensis]KAG2393806.1 hypothetical protein C9374_003570 [Naegleria lovaniensis]